MKAANDAVVDLYAEKRVRHGKTAKDRADGATKRNHDNKEVRAAWVKENASKSTGVTPFPWHTCNGQKTRAMRRK